VLLILLPITVVLETCLSSRSVKFPVCTWKFDWLVLNLQLLKEDEPDNYQSHFSGFMKESIEADDLANMYTKVHIAIRADPVLQQTEEGPC